ncbi:uridine kinase [Actinomycetes bacterium KLBMP 9759]
MDLAGAIAAHITTELRSRPRLTVAFDGPDAAGKTTLADEVAKAVPAAVRASIDGFHRPAAERRLRGDLSPEGYYDDTFQLERVHDAVEEFRAGAATIVTAEFDLATDRPHVERRPVPARAALLFDGVFLQRPELRDLWDVTIYLRVPEDVTLQRALSRDVGLFGSRENVERRYRTKYLPGQAVYRRRVGPELRADLFVENTDHDAPVVVRDRFGIMPPADSSDS